MLKPKNAKTPREYLSQIEEPRRSQVEKVFHFIQSVMPNEKPYIHAGMLAFKPYHYKYASGREGDWFVVGLASQKNYISVYVCASDAKQYVAEKYKDQLGKVSVGKSCIRFKHPDDIDFEVLRKVLKEGVALTSSH